MGIFSRLRRAPAAPTRATRRFDAAAGGRRWESHPHFGRTGAETLAASAPIRSRAGYFVANNAWASNGVGALVAGLVGTGITPASAHPDPETRARIGAAFAAWGRNCDADGRTDLFGLQAAAVSGLVVDGEAFLHMEQTAAGLRLRLVPPEMVDESDTRELPAGAHRVAGVEFDASGHRVAYMILPHRPTDTNGRVG